MRDKTRMVQFRTSVFLRHFAGLNFSSNEHELLRLLALYSPLPLPIIADVLELNIEVLHNIMIKLIDLALVITNEYGNYRIADPVADAAISAFGFPSDKHNKALVRILSNFLKNHQIESPQLELSRVLFRAAQMTRDSAGAKTIIHLASDLIKLTETQYHARRYKNVIETAYIALKERPDSVSARSFLIRALINEEEWEEAETQLNELKKHAPIRDVYFLTGFLERKRNRIYAAIDAYEKANKLGWKGAAVNRELALCHFLSNDYEQASKYIEEALARHSDNKYVVDLWAQIAIRRLDENAARKALAILEVIDASVFYYHRLSRFEMAFGRTNEALKAARFAVKAEDSPPFEVFAHYIYCEIDAGNLDKAEELLAKLDTEFANIRRDVRVGLRCRLEISKSKFKEALLQSERIGDKGTYFYKRIRRDALFGELQSSALPDKVRKMLKDELNELDKELSGIPIVEFMLTEL